MKQMVNQVYAILSLVKLPLLMCVILAHCNFLNDGYSIGLDDSVVKFLNYFSYIIRPCVPLFFLISAFLLFYNIPNFNIDVYLNKLRRRYYSLIIPYLAWNFIGAILFWCKTMPMFASLYPNYQDIEFSILEFLQGFVYSIDGFPYNFPLWYVRNLIVFVAISPFIYYIVRSLRIYSVILCFLVVYFFDIEFHGLQYFVLGAFLAVNKIEILKYLNQKLLLCGAFLLVGVLHLIFKIENPIVYQTLLEMEILLGMLVFLSIGCLMSKWNVKWEFFIAPLFFVYSIHGLFCSIIRRVVLEVLHPEKFIEFVLSYIIIFIVIILISVVIYWCIKLVSPRAVNLLSGNRNRVKNINLLD